jgi:hypothetical protein
MKLIVTSQFYFRVSSVEVNYKLFLDFDKNEGGMTVTFIDQL